ncbi:MAG: hypothetical protein H0T46_04450 [Deltaproteobacteria bacterium]|nr:hypothetical protein [Deltaproteobacteria bacterium]
MQSNKTFHTRFHTTFTIAAIIASGAGCATDGDADADDPTEEYASELLGCYGTIDAKYQALGGPGGFGQPLIPESTTAGSTGTHRVYSSGAIYRRFNQCAWAVQGGILEKWGAQGWELGVLGYPVSDEEWVTDQRGRVSHFERGSIYWSPATGAAAIRGPIRTKWLAMGGVHSVLGYPVRDEAKAIRPPVIQEFEWGTIYSSPLATPYAVYGAIGQLHRELGGATGVAGAPTTDESSCWPSTLGTRCQRFERGMITWTASVGPRFRPS